MSEFLTAAREGLSGVAGILSPTVREERRQSQLLNQQTQRENLKIILNQTLQGVQNGSIPQEQGMQAIQQILPQLGVSPDTAKLFQAGPSVATQKAVADHQADVLATQRDLANRTKLSRYASTVSDPALKEIFSDPHMWKDAPSMRKAIMETRKPDVSLHTAQDGTLHVIDKENRRDLGPIPGFVGKMPKGTTFTVGPDGTVVAEIDGGSGSNTKLTPSQQGKLERDFIDAEDRTVKVLNRLQQFHETLSKPNATLGPTSEIIKLAESFRSQIEQITGISLFDANGQVSRAALSSSDLSQNTADAIIAGDIDSQVIDLAYIFASSREGGKLTDTDVRLAMETFAGNASKEVVKGKIIRIMRRIHKDQNMLAANRRRRFPGSTQFNDLDLGVLGISIPEDAQASPDIDILVNKYAD